jgi:3-oxoacyl-[acyl-carrier-protein] synthase II
MHKRVVITGMGALTPIGNNVADFWAAITSGTSGAAPITRFEASSFKTQFACELKNFDVSQHLDRADLKRTDLYTQYALVASDEAIKDSGLSIKDMDPFEYAIGNGQPRFSPFFVPKFLINMASGLISLRNGFMGINYTAVSACASGNTAIMDAFNYIRLDKAKVILTGGSEAPISKASVGGFSSMKAMSTKNEASETASRPFDAHRDGFVMGEGAGALVLEEYEHALARGAKIYGELVGAAMTADAYHMTTTHPEGLGASQAMRLALKEANLTINDVDYLNAHATSTPVGDLSEIKAIVNLIGTESNHLKISATKSMTGHLLGAAGAIEAIICLLSIKDGIIPPTINTVELDASIPENLNIITGSSLSAKVNVAMSNTFGFGGHNATVIFAAV